MDDFIENILILLGLIIIGLISIGFISILLKLIKEIWMR